MTLRIHLVNIDKLLLTEEYVSWLNDPNVTRFLEVRHQVHSLDTINQYYDKIRSNSSNIWKAIVATDDSRHIGNIKCSINRYGVGELSLFIGNKDYWGQGIGALVISLMVKTAYEEGAVKLIAYIYETNKPSIRAFCKCGFSLEAVLKNEVTDLDSRIDILRVVHNCN